jgi:formate/nitrite transporter FocA (FNT family)
MKNEEIKLDPDEEKAVEDRLGLSAPAIYETIRREGDEELERPAFSLALSGLMAGIAIGFSVDRRGHAARLHAGCTVASSG